MKARKPMGSWWPESICLFSTAPWTLWSKITDQPLSPQGPLCDITDHFLWGVILWLYQKTTLPGIYLPRCSACLWGHLLCLMKLFVETECLQVKNLLKLTQHRAGPRLALVQCRRRVPTTSASAAGTKTAKIFF